jgi:hypothetical protein
VLGGTRIVEIEARGETRHKAVDAAVDLAADARTAIAAAAAAFADPDSARAAAARAAFATSRAAAAARAAVLIDAADDFFIPDTSRAAVAAAAYDAAAASAAAFDAAAYDATADFKALLELNLGLFMELGRPIDPSEKGPLGPFWPKGAITPKKEPRRGRPRESTADEVRPLTVYLDPGDAPPRLIAELYMALSAVYRAHGGSGLEIVENDQRILVGEEVSR